MNSCMMKINKLNYVTVLTLTIPLSRKKGGQLQYDIFVYRLKLCFNAINIVKSFNSNISLKHNNIYTTLINVIINSDNARKLEI